MKREIPKEIEVPQWYNPGSGMMYNRDCLSSDHPESTYSYIKNELGLKPEDYGVYHTDALRREDLLALTKEELAHKIVQLEKEILYMEKNWA